MLLLDTHVLLWWLADDARLGPDARTRLRSERDNPVYSPASPFEIAIKVSTGKMRLDLHVALAALMSAGLRELPFTGPHYRTLAGLPLLHGDPFDRMIVAQAIAEGAVIMTSDAAIGRYPVRTIGCD